MRRKLCIPKGRDLGLLAPRQESATCLPPSDSLKHSRWWGQAGKSSLDSCLVSKMLPTRHPSHLSHIHASWGCLCCELACVQLCVLAQDCLARVQFLPSRALGYRGADRGGGEGAHGDILSPTPRGSGLREGGGASLISLLPWQGGPLVLRWPVGEPGEASLRSGRGVPESTGAAAAGGVVGLLGARLQLASWVLQSCQWHGGSAVGVTWPTWPLGCRCCHHRGSFQRP